MIQSSKIGTISDHVIEKLRKLNYRTQNCSQNKKIEAPISYLPF